MPRPFNEEMTVFPTNGARKNGYPHAKERSWSLNSYHIQKLKQIKDRSVKAKTIKLLKENIGEKL